MPEKISNFFAARLHTPFTNDRWSWGTYDEDENRVFLRVWEHGLSSDHSTMEVLWDEERLSHPGAKERRRHVELMLAGTQAFGVLCIRKEGSANNQIKSFDRDQLLRLGKPKHVGNRWRSPILGKISVSDIHAAKQQGEAAEQVILESEQLTETEKQNLIAARRGQGLYRRRLLEKWNNKCAATGCSIQDVLRASHAKPWAVSTNEERLDPHNGLPLIATIDALFDRGLIGFGASGEMLISDEIADEERALIGIPQPLRKPPSKRCAAYLEWHIAERFRG